MEYLEIEVKTAFIVHGYDENNHEIVENVNDPEFMKKMVSIERIQSISEQYLLVTSSHGRVMYWEYKESMVQLAERLRASGIKII